MRFLLLLFLLLFPQSYTPEPVVEGYASAYAPGVMDATVRYRLETGVWWNIPPYNWYMVHGYIASMDCTHVGSIAWLTVGEETLRVLVSDCAGDDGPLDRFEKINVVAELDWRLWERLTEKYGKPLPITVTYH